VSRLALRPTQSPTPSVMESFPGGKSLPGIEAIHSPHLVPLWKMSRSYISSTLWQLHGGSGAAFTFMIYLTTLPIARTKKGRMVGQFMNIELEVIVSWFKVRILSWNMATGLRKNTKISARIASLLDEFWKTFRNYNPALLIIQMIKPPSARLLKMWCVVTIRDEIS
jgi:hypothetical protein